MSKSTGLKNTFVLEFYVINDEPKKWVKLF